MRPTSISNNNDEKKDTRKLSSEHIRRRAYELYVQRGRKDGDDLQVRSANGIRRSRLPVHCARRFP